MTKTGIFRNASLMLFLSLIAIMIILAAGCVMEPKPASNDTFANAETYCGRITSLTDNFGVKVSVCGDYVRVFVPGNGSSSYTFYNAQANATGCVLGCSPQDEMGLLDAECKALMKLNCTQVCTAGQRFIAEKYCGGTNVSMVYACGDYVRVVSSIDGGGSTFYDVYDRATSCPFGTPGSETAECNALFNLNCTAIC